MNYLDHQQIIAILNLFVPTRTNLKNIVLNEKKQGKFSFMEKYHYCKSKALSTHFPFAHVKAFFFKHWKIVSDSTVFGSRTVGRDFIVFSVKVQIITDQYIHIPL